MKFLKITNSSQEGTLKPYFPGWLTERYGECFAQISTLSTLKAKMAVRDVARATLGEVPQDIEDWCKRFEIPPQGIDDLKFILGWSNDEGTHQGSIERDEALKAYITKYPDQWEIVKKALSLPRQYSKHASAFIVANKSIQEFIPIITVGNARVTAFSGPEVEAVGGLKMDWLVVKCINDIQGCLNLIDKKYKCQSNSVTINSKYVPNHRLVLDPVSEQLSDIWDLPTDLNVYQEISSGKTETVFQFNTHGAVKWLKYFNFTRPDNTPGINSIEAMAAFTALDRPGPLNYEVRNPDNLELKHNVLVEYARRVRGLEGSPDIFPIFNKLLPQTYSLIIYQEDLQRIYQELTGCTVGEAEKFRKFSAKKKPEEMAKAYVGFIQKASEKLGKEEAQQVWDSIVNFSAYSFNKSHSVSYVIISYACAWLKHHYPLEWWCAVLTNATKEKTFDEFHFFTKNFVKLPDLNKSKLTWVIEDETNLRAPIDLCYGIGETAHAQLIKYAPYESLDDFCQKIVLHRKSNADKEGTWGRSAINIGTIYTMICAGVMDSLFDSSLSVAERLDLYQSTLKKYVTAAGGKYTKSKTNYPVLDAISRYQARKDILPIYCEDIRLHYQLFNNNSLFKIGEGLYYKHPEWSRREGKEVIVQDRVVGEEELTEIRNVNELPQYGYRCAVIAYVEGKETFQAKSKTAKRFNLDACGFRSDMLYWPDNNGQFPAVIEKVTAGSIVAVVLTRNNINYGFTIRGMEILRGAPSRE
jgi:DNA polymerase III subunit alpha